MPWNGGVNTTLEESLISNNQLTQANNVELGVDGARKKREGINANFDSGLFEVTKMVTVDGSSLDGKFFRLEDDAGSVGFWYDVAGGTTIPAGASALDRAVEITTVGAGDTATQVGDKTATAVQADSKFVAYNNTTTVTVIQNVAGNRTNAVDGDTTFTITSPTDSFIRLHDFHYGSTSSKTQRLIAIGNQNTYFTVNPADGSCKALLQTM